MSLLFPALMALTAIAVLAVLWPVFRRPRPVERSHFELEIYRDQLAEIERDRERGLIAPEEARAARLEIERRLLRVADEAEAVPAEAPGRGRGPVLAAALLVPILGAGFYAALGSPELPDQPLALRQQQSPDMPDVEQMVARLEARLAEKPDDLEGWLMLGRSRAALGNSHGAVEAFRRAQSLAPDDPRSVAGLAEALAAANAGVVTPEARELFQRLAPLGPADPRAGFYLGWAAHQAGGFNAPLGRWRLLLAASPADAPWRPQVIEAIRAAAGELALDADQVLAQIPPAPPATTPGPTAEDVASAEAMTPEERMEMIRGMVDKLQARMDADGADVEGWLRLAQSRLVLGEPERARATFEQALGRHPAEPSLLKGYAMLLIGPAPAGGELPRVSDQAQDLLARAGRLQPDDPEIWWLLGIRALQDGREAEARAAWEKVLARLDPAQPEYAAIKSRLEQLGG